MTNSALRRMTKPAPRPPRAQGLGDVARRVLPRIAAEMPGVMLEVVRASTRGVKLHGAVRDLPAETLLIELERDGAKGVAALSPEIRRAMIECLATGGIGPLPTEPRPPTDLDFALCAHVLDRWFLALAEAGPDAPASPARCLRRVSDAREIELSMDDPLVERHAFELDLGQGVLLGEFTLLLPPYVAGRDAAGLSDALRAALLPVRAEVHVVLSREVSTLGAIAALTPGDILPITRANLAAVSVEAPLGTRHAVARLGQSRGCRAVRFDTGEGGQASTQPPGADAMPLPEPLAIGDLDAGGADAAEPLPAPAPLAEPPQL